MRSPYGCTVSVGVERALSPCAFTAVTSKVTATPTVRSVMVVLLAGAGTAVYDVFPFTRTRYSTIGSPWSSGSAHASSAAPVRGAAVTSAGASGVPVSIVMVAVPCAVSSCPASASRYQLPATSGADTAASRPKASSSLASTLPSRSVSTSVLRHPVGARLVARAVWLVLSDASNVHQVACSCTAVSTGKPTRSGAVFSPTKAHGGAHGRTAALHCESPPAMACALGAAAGAIVVIAATTRATGTATPTCRRNPCPRMAHSLSASAGPDRSALFPISRPASRPTSLIVSARTQS